MSESVFQRFEIKFLLEAPQRASLEWAMSHRLEPDVHGESTICNLYYDTPDFRLIRRSKEKPAYKEKLRLRSYGRVRDNGTVFLELKKKYKGVVYKRRVALPESQSMTILNDGGRLEQYGQIGRELDYTLHFYPDLRPAVYLCYDRCAFTCKDDPQLRITFDRNIRWRDTDLLLTAPIGGEQLLQPGQSLMEIKTASSIPLWLVALLEREQLHKTSFSKYGAAYQNLLIRRNNERKDGIPCA